MLTRQGLWAQAEAGFREALAILRRLNRQGQFSRGTVLAGLGAALAPQGHTAQARELLSQAIACLEAEKSASLPDVMINLGVICDQEGLNDEAEGWFLRVMSRFEQAQASGEPDIHVVRTRKSLGECYTRRGNYQLAQSVLKRALDLAGPSNARHPMVLAVSAQYACVVQRLQKLPP